MKKGMQMESAVMGSRVDFQLILISATRIFVSFRNSDVSDEENCVGKKFNLLALSFFPLTERKLNLLAR
jgi:hypothetical protein